MFNRNNNRRKSIQCHYNVTRLREEKWYVESVT
jgi:hypothetical protein